MDSHGRAVGVVRRVAGRGGSGRRFAAGPFAPGRLEKMVPLRQTGALESYCGSRSACRRSASAKTVLRVPRLADVQGTVEAHEADLPLVIRTARGFGQIIFVAADLDRPPLDTMARSAVAGGQAAGHARRPRRGIGRDRGHDALRLQRPLRPVAQRARSFRRRAARAVLAGGRPDRGLPAADRPGRLLLPPQTGRPHGLDLADVSLGRAAGVSGGICAGLPAQGRPDQDQPGRSGGRGRRLGPDARHHVAERLQPADGIVQSGDPSRGCPTAASRASPRVDGLAGTAGHGPGRHESPRRRPHAVDATLQLLALAGRPVRRADPGVVHQESLPPGGMRRRRRFRRPI